MNTKGCKQKGRTFQQQCAEAIAIHLGLTIQAEPPTKPGTRANDAVYVPETDPADLRIRRMGQPGADIVLASEKARTRVADSASGRAYWIECKNTEDFTLDAKFWSHGSAWLEKVQVATVLAANSAGMAPLVLVKRNGWPAFAWARGDAQWVGWGNPLFCRGGWWATTLKAFLEMRLA